MKEKIYYSLAGALCLLSTAIPVLACPDIDGLVDINCDRKVEIIAFGDSITYGDEDPTGLGYPGRLELIFPHVNVHNQGRPGEDTWRGRDRAPGSFYRYAASDYGIVLEGVNDYWREGHSSSTTRNNLLSIVGSGQSMGITTLLANLTEVRRSSQRGWVASVNALLAPYRDIDFYSLGSGIISGDLLHPSGSGYQAMAEFAAGVIRQVSEAHRPVDTDADGIYDFAEAQFGANPLLVDSDNDGLRDGDEVFVYNSSPAMLDTDGDGFTDPQEVQMGSNPASPLPGAPTLHDLQVIN